MIIQMLAIKRDSDGLYFIHALDENNLMYRETPRLWDNHINVATQIKQHRGLWEGHSVAYFQVEQNNIKPITIHVTPRE